MMPRITQAARTALNCVVLFAFAVALAANAAVPVPPPKPPPKHKPYQPGEQTDVTASYEYRTRILAGKPGCQRFATASDAAFLDDKTDDKTKVALLNKIGADTAASACLGP